MFCSVGYLIVLIKADCHKIRNVTTLAVLYKGGLAVLLKLEALGLALFGLHGNSCLLPYFRNLVRWAELFS